jgi:hypothetical protein
LEKNKSFDEILQETYQEDQIEAGDIDKEDWLELDPENAKSIKKAMRKWLEQKRAEISARLENQSITENVAMDKMLQELLKELK